MKISRITISHHRLPLDPPFDAAWDPVPRAAVPATIVRVETDSGLVGVGSGDPMPGFEGHEDLFVGHDARDLDRHHRIIDNLSFHHGRCWPLDAALWDLKGKALGQPVWRLLGGSSGRVRLYASTGTLRPPAGTAEIARQLVDAGFTAMKIRMHSTDWRHDVARIEAARGAVGDALAIMVDANQAWRMPWDAAPYWTLKDARDAARALEALDVFWLEEPLQRGDLAGMADLRRATGVRIAAAEIAREMHDLRAMIDRRCIDILQPDAVQVGGITGLAQIAREAEARGIGFTPHTWGNGIGLLANAHLMAGIGGQLWLEFPLDPPTWTPERRDFMLAEPLSADDGWLDLGDAPGLGITLDEERLAATRVG